MKYLNEKFCELINATEQNREVLAQWRRDVDAFMPTFSDDPEKLSRWGHHYFCDDDGGRLIFDLHKPHEHKCVVCGKIYSGEVYDGVWVTMYRNRAVVMALVSAAVYKATGETKYRDYAVQVIDFYARNYHKFVLHNKENVICDSYENMVWGCAKMMPQGLNEAIVAIRFIQTIEILRDELDKDWLDMVHQKLFREIYYMLKPQVVAIHNISCWDLSAIGVMGLAMGDQEMVDFAFGCEFNMHEQLKKGVTQDAFWYEGSIHYNFFLLEGVSYLFLFSKLYDYDFGAESTTIFEKMFLQAHEYAFDNLYLPNPNDGWPDLNLQTFSYVYHTVARAFGEDSPVGNITKIIEASPEKRTTLPLSEPYYCGDICLEQMLFNIDFDYASFTEVPRYSKSFEKSNFGMLRNNRWNAFMKYGLNGKSHAHPDIMTVEIMLDGHRITRDLSNAGYQSKLCNEWHRKTLCHNTVCRNGEDITSVSPGVCTFFAEQKMEAKATNVYQGIDYTRSIEISEDCLRDHFSVNGPEAVYDYVFHFESDIQLHCDLELEESSLGFDRNGYQHIIQTRKAVPEDQAVTLYACYSDVKMKVILTLADGQELYLLKTMDNPVNQIRSSILIRSKCANPNYQMVLKVNE